MKKVFAFLSVIFLLLGISQAQTVRFSYHFENLQVISQGDYQLVYFDGTRQLGELGKPSLPFMPVKLLLPQGTEIKDFQIVKKNKITLPQKINLYPTQAVRPLSAGKSGIFHKDQKTYTLEKYPQKSTLKLSTEYMNGFSIALGSFSPVEYNPAKQELSYYQDVEIIITLKTSEKSRKASQMLSNRKDVLDKIKNFVQNPQMIEKYNLAQNKDITDDYEVLIITNNSFANSFGDLQNLYLTHGLRSQVATVENINSTMQGRDLQEKIRNYIIQEYQNHNIEYVLLAGDVSIVPYRGFYCSVNSGGQIYEDDNIPADLYYSALDGTWNSDNDNLWGEPDEDDLLPEVAVGRLPFETTTELQNMLHKVLSYQISPVVGELNRPLLAGEYLYDNPETWGADYLRLLIGHHEDNGYTTDGIPRTTPYDSLFDQNSSWSGQDIINAINQGHPFVHHVGHSNSDYMMKLYSSDITDANFSNVDGTTHNYTLVYSHGCICGAFDNDDCIAEQSLKISKFAVAELVNSRYGWFDEGTTEGPSEHLHREYVDALYHDKAYQVGMAELYSKIATAPWVNQENEFEPGAQRWCFYDHNALGDPAMNIWTDNPYDITVNYPSEFVIGYDANQVDISCDQPVYATCAVVQNGVLVGRGYTNGNNTAEVEIWTNATPGQATLYVSGYNILTQQYTVNIGNAQNALISVSNIAIEDNDNQEINYNETISFVFTLHNIGSQQATNVSITASKPTNNNNYQIISSTENVGTIDANQEVETQGNIRIKVKYPTDYQKDTIVFNIHSDQNDITKTYIFRYHTPHFKLQNISITETNGNGNGYLEPGEQGQITFTIENDGHGIASAGTFTLNVENTGINIDNTNVSTEPIASGETFSQTCNITVSDDYNQTQPLNLTARLQTNGYYINITAEIPIGPISEDYETGDFTKFDWQSSGDSPWVIDQSTVHTGDYSAKSGDITDNQHSDMYLTLNILTDGQISFYRKVSSESGWDYLKFYIDGTKIDEWSGEQDWQQETYNVSAGEHTFKWTYVKDGSVSDGQDCGWIDDITFPPIGISNVENGTDTTAYVNTLQRFATKIYPNPCTDYITFEFEAKQSDNVVISIYDLQGHAVLKQVKSAYKGENVIMLPVNELQAGIYIWQIIIDGKFANGKFIKE